MYGDIARSELFENEGYFLGRQDLINLTDTVYIYLMAISIIRTDRLCCMAITTSSTILKMCTKNSSPKHNDVLS